MFSFLFNRSKTAAKVTPTTPAATVTATATSDPKELSDTFLAGVVGAGKGNTSIRIGGRRR